MNPELNQSIDEYQGRSMMSSVIEGAAAHGVAFGAAAIAIGGIIMALGNRRLHTAADKVLNTIGHEQITNKLSHESTSHLNLLNRFNGNLTGLRLPGNFHFATSEGSKAAELIKSSVNEILATPALKEQMLKLSAETGASDKIQKLITKHVLEKAKTTKLEISSSLTDRIESFAASLMPPDGTKGQEVVSYIEHCIPIITEAQALKTNLKRTLYAAPVAAAAGAAYGAWTNADEVNVNRARYEGIKQWSARQNQRISELEQVLAGKTGNDIKAPTSAAR